MRVIDKYKPDELYNLAAQSFVALVSQSNFNGKVTALA